MSLSKEAEEAKPKKPLTGFFKFRKEQLDKGEGSVKNVKVLWDSLDEAKKKVLDDEFKLAHEKWKVDM